MQVPVLAHEGGIPVRACSGRSRSLAFGPAGYWSEVLASTSGLLAHWAWRWSSSCPILRVSGPRFRPWLAIRGNGRPPDRPWRHGGLGVTHRPLARLHAVGPRAGSTSARLPSYRAPGDRARTGSTSRRSSTSSTRPRPRAARNHADEIRFVRERGLRYLGSPSDGLESDRFLDETFALAQDPDAWPILVHCHGLHGSIAGLDGTLSIPHRKPSARRRLSRDRATPGVASQGGRLAPIQSQAADPRPPTLRGRPDLPDPPPLRRRHRRPISSGPGGNRTATTRKVVTRIEPDPKTRRP